MSEQMPIFRELEQIEKFRKWNETIRVMREIMLRAELESPVEGTKVINAIERVARKEVGQISINQLREILKEMGADLP